MGTLRDSSGRPVTSGSGQPVKTRYDDDEDKASKASESENDYSHSSRRARTIEEQIGRKKESKAESTTQDEEPSRKISDYIKSSPSGVFSNVTAAIESATRNNSSGDRTVSPVTAAANNNTRKSAVVKEAASASAPASAPKKEAVDKYKDIPVRKMGKAVEDTGKQSDKSISPKKIQEERRSIATEKRERTKSPEFPLKGDTDKQSDKFISSKKIQEERRNIVMKKRESDKAATENRKEFGMKKGGVVSSASSRGDGIAQRGKTRGRLC
jgi:hypothetical protein